MSISAIDGKIDGKALIPKLDLALTPEPQETNNNKQTESFMDVLMNAIGEVDTLQKNAESSAEKLALGDESYLHNTMIAYEKANLALQLTIEVRNRIIEAYQEIMRIQM